MIPIFDGHNDLLLRLRRTPDQRDALWADAKGAGHLDLTRMRAGGMVGGLFAIFVPDANEGPPPDDRMQATSYDLPLPAPVPQQQALQTALAMAGDLHALSRTGTLRLCLNARDIEAAIKAKSVAAVMHMEGAEAIDTDLGSLVHFHAMGLRSLGPVWSRPTAFGHGVPFRFPGHPDTGPGLTEAGKRLITACNDLRIMVDLSHLNAKGMEDVARLSNAPLVATHSNAHTITPSTRNLTDRQLKMIAETGGMVGLNFATVFLRPDGRQDANTGWDPILRHLDHLITHLGEDHVGLGSDFDGAVIPNVIKDATGLPNLISALRAQGYSDNLLTKLCHQNWINTLSITWGS